jgi:hypothetical protein
MKKSRAIELLGGSVAAAAEAVGVSSAAISQWPEDLPTRLKDRVLAALARKHLPEALIREFAEEPEPGAPALETAPASLG